MSEIDDFAALKQYEYRALLNSTDLGPFIADPEIRLIARRLAIPVFDATSGVEYFVDGAVQHRAEIELSLRDGIKALETVVNAGDIFLSLKFASRKAGTKDLTFPHVHPVPKVQFIPSAKFGHRTVLIYYATPDTNGKLFTFA